VSAATLARPTVPDRPPAPTAPAVLEHRDRMERELAELKSRIGQTAYGAAISGKGGAEALATLHAKIQAAEFALAASEAAHIYAGEADRAAVATWREEVNAMPPEQALAGLTRRECCRRCNEANGCVISSGQECLHPLKAGQVLHPRHANKPHVRRLQRAAAEHLGVLR
jgi:hypothetical protein